MPPSSVCQITPRSPTAQPHVPLVKQTSYSAASLRIARTTAIVGVETSLAKRFFVGVGAPASGSEPAARISAKPNVNIVTMHAKVNGVCLRRRQSIVMHHPHTNQKNAAFVAFPPGDILVWSMLFDLHRCT